VTKVFDEGGPDVCFTAMLLQAGSKKIMFVQAIKLLNWYMTWEKGHLERRAKELLSTLSQCYAAAITPWLTFGGGSSAMAKRLITQAGSKLSSDIRKYLKKALLEGC
jgi:hypothetical protein